MIKFGIKESVWNSIREVMMAYPEVESVILYGSRAKGNFKPASDIDLTFKGDLLTLSILNKIALDLDDLLLPYMMDLSIFNQLSNEALIDHIERVGIQIYKKQEK